MPSTSRSILLNCRALIALPASHCRQTVSRAPVHITRQCTLSFQKSDNGQRFFSFIERGHLKKDRLMYAGRRLAKEDGDGIAVRRSYDKIGYDFRKLIVYGRIFYYDSAAANNILNAFRSVLFEGAFDVLLCQK